MPPEGRGIYGLAAGQMTQRAIVALRTLSSQRVKILKGVIIARAGSRRMEPIFKSNRVLECRMCPAHKERFAEFDVLQSLEQRRYGCLANADAAYGGRFNDRESNVLLARQVEQCIEKICCKPPSRPAADNNDTELLGIGELH